MKNVDTNSFLDRLEERARTNIATLEALRRCNDEELNRRPAPKAWTALEALEHLNRFNPAYLERIEVATRNGEPSTSPFTSSRFGGWLGRWAKPGNSTFKVPTFPGFNPRTPKPLKREVADNCLENAHRLAAVLTAARTVDLTRTRIKTVETPFIKLRLGDALRMLVNHDWRHIEQAERATRGLAGIRVEQTS